MKNFTIDGGVLNFSGRNSGRNVPNAAFLTDSAVASNQARLVSELEKLDPKVRMPLTSVTYPRDIPIKSGGGWVDRVSAMNVTFGVSGGSGDNLVGAGGSNSPGVVQANFDSDSFSAFVFSIIMRVGYVDMQRGNILGRSLDSLLTDGIRLAYDKHQEENVYIGKARYGTHGILNNPDVTAASVSTGASGQTAFKDKTADEVLANVNALITATWAQAEHDLDALPNHMLMPYEQYNYLATTKVSPLAEKTILSFILENNITTQNGGNLVIGATNFCKGAGTGNTDRMVCYVHKDRYIAMEELVPLSRSLTGPNVQDACYDTLYLANNTQVEFFYTQTIRYADGI